jgi:hypothetical protein
MALIRIDLLDGVTEIFLHYIEITQLAIDMAGA